MTRSRVNINDTYKEYKMICANDILIVADKAEFKAFKVTATKMGTQNVELIQDVIYMDSHKKMGALLSDKAGNLGHNNGDRKYIKREMNRKSLGMILADTKKVLTKNLNSNWHISAPSSLLNNIVSNLDSHLYKSLGMILSKDLVNTKKAKLLTYFH